MKVLVFGFSVTGDTPGYVEFWKERHGAKHPDISLEKLAIGGVMPPQGRHLIPSVLRQYKPDIVVFEIATPIYRLRPRTPEVMAEHQLTVDFLVCLCASLGIRCAFLDLPQTQLIPARDWLGEIHRRTLPSHGVPHIELALIPDTLRDNVHPNDRGRCLYADALEDLLQQTRAAPIPARPPLGLNDHFDCYPADQLARTGGTLVDFERNGFRSRVVQLQADQAATFSLPRASEVVGVMISMGPRTGYMDIRMNNTASIICCYDKHCYYQRIGARPLPPRISDAVTVVQGRVVPDIALEKGHKNTDSRLGGISHFLIRGAWNDHGV